MSVDPPPSRPTNAVVLTTINPPNAVASAIASGSVRSGWDFVVVGDSAGPAEFALPGSRFLSVDTQHASGFRLARACPLRSYARKNIGYLDAMARGATCIVETDDDNVPDDAFFTRRERWQTAPQVNGAGWVNVYRYFTDATIWPRGLPLDRINVAPPALASGVASTVDCPIQQGLVNKAPDVDAIYHLVFPAAPHFRTDRRLALGKGSWCPFNSQNTTWWADAFALMYLPAHCSFRMTDIWRSFVAQRIAWENGWSILFHPATVTHERNLHNLMRDFADEVPGYLNNDRIRRALEDVALAGPGRLDDDLRRCYQTLVELDVVGEPELTLLDCWIADVCDIRAAQGGRT